MAHFAKVENSLVTQVVVADQEFINSGIIGDSSMWVQTSYNTVEGAHLNGGIPLRKNFASIGYTYDKELDAFIPPKPFASWVLSTDTCQWYPPFNAPEDGNKYIWNEVTQSWDLINN